MLDVDIALLAAAWLTGLAGGGGHCIGMCGGIVGALGLRQHGSARGLALLLCAHAGRVFSYSAAGGVAGFAGAAAAGGLAGAPGLAALRIAAGALVAVIGLQLLLGRPLLTPLERGGARIWRSLAPLLRALLPPRNPARAFAVGALWGWLPCGLVYAELSVAAAAGGATQGAALMAAFGVGTVLSLSLLGALLQAVGLARLPRRASGALLVAFGLWTAMPGLLGPSGDSGHGGHAVEAVHHSRHEGELPPRDRNEAALRQP
jgi:sulfite exporter TauE/SafE